MKDTLTRSNPGAKDNMPLPHNLLIRLLCKVIDKFSYKKITNTVV